MEESDALTIEEPKETSNMLRIAKLATVLLAVAIVTVSLAGCSGGEESTTGEMESGTPSAAARPEGTEDNVGTAIGQVPPPFELPDLEGNVVSLSDFEGDVIILDMWATWCPPCRQEIPFLVSLYEEYKDRGLAVVGVGLDRGGASVLAPFVEENGVTYTILVGDDSIGRLYGVSGIPMTLMIDRNGLVASKEVGFAPSMEEGMRAKVLELLEQKATEA